MAKSNKKYKQANWRGNVLSNARRSSITKRPQPSKALFNRLYDKPKTVVFKERANPYKFFAFSCEDMLTEMTASAKGIYAALCCLSDFLVEKQIQVSIENIGVYTGLSDWTTIKKGLDELSSLHLIRGEKIINKRQYWIYSTDFIRKSDLENYQVREWFPFYSCIVETGVWAKLTPKAQSLYLTLRALAEFELESTDSDYGESLRGGDDFVSFYKNREYDSYASTWANLSNQSGIHYTSLKLLIAQLEEYGLVSLADWTTSCILNIYFRPSITQELIDEGLI